MEDVKTEKIVKTVDTCSMEAWRGGLPAVATIWVAVLNTVTSPLDTISSLAVAENSPVPLSAAAAAGIECCTCRPPAEIVCCNVCQNCSG